MKRAEHEHQQQAALIQWVRLQERVVPELQLLFAVPNGAKRHPAVAGKLKAEGVRAGVPDLCLPVPRCGYTGLWIEMKAGDNGVTAKQAEFHRQLARYGHHVVVCHEWESAKRILVDYLHERLPVKAAA